MPLLNACSLLQAEETQEFKAEIDKRKTVKAAQEQQLTASMITSATTSDTQIRGEYEKAYKVAWLANFSNRLNLIIFRRRWN